MNYRSVRDRCAMDVNSLNLSIAKEKVLEILTSKGFSVIAVDIIALARQCMVHSCYKRGARLSEAPHVVDCSSLIKWLYGERGIWLPRRSIQQRDYGDVVSFEEISKGDVVFVSGYIDYYHTDPSDGVGHVGIATGEGTVIHAAGEPWGVVETPLDIFVEKGKFRGARRYIPSDENVITLKISPLRDVEVSDDLRWIVLQSL